MTMPSTRAWGMRGATPVWDSPFHRNFGRLFLNLQFFRRYFHIIFSDFCGIQWIITEVGNCFSFFPSSGGRWIFQIYPEKNNSKTTTSWRSSWICEFEIAGPSCPTPMPPWRALLRFRQAWPATNDCRHYVQIWKSKKNTQLSGNSPSVDNMTRSFGPPPTCRRCSSLLCYPAPYGRRTGSVRGMMKLTVWMLRGQVTVRCGRSSRSFDFMPMFFLTPS